MPRDLVAGGVEDRDLALEDRDERVALVADPVQGVARVGRALLAELGKRRELRRRQRWAVRDDTVLRVLVPFVVMGALGVARSASRSDR